MKAILSLFLVSALALPAKTLDEVIQQARGFIGPEEALESVEALRFSGVLDPEAEGAEAVDLELLIQKPAKQKLVVQGSKGSTTSVIDQMQGYVIQENFESGRKAVGPMATEQLQDLRANSIENLYFYRFPTRLQIRVKFMGEEEIRGQKVNVVRFVHRGGIVYMRYFDVETGALVATRTENGMLNVEKGRRVVNGLKFAEKVESYRNGELLHTIRFGDITVNPEVPDDAFEVK